MTAADYTPVNTALMANPWNWVVILLMVSIAGLGLSLLFPSPSGD